MPSPVGIRRASNLDDATLLLRSRVSKREKEKRDSLAAPLDDRARSSDRRFNPAASSRIPRRDIAPIIGAVTRASAPVDVIDRVTRDPSPFASTRCRAAMRRPGIACVSHVNARPASNSVTCHVEGARPCSRTRARAVFRSSPPSSSLMLRVDRVHSGHRSTSAITDHTTDGAASISTTCSIYATAIETSYRHA